VHIPLVCSGPGIRANVTIDKPVSKIDVGATILDFADVKTLDGMTAVSYRGLLEGEDVAHANRSTVYSGLQSDDFGKENEDMEFNFRVAISDFENSVFKFVCCYGECPGAPSTINTTVDSDGYTRLLFDTVNDQFDSVDLKNDENYTHIATVGNCTEKLFYV